MQAIAATADGMYVAGGGASGTIYIWATGSGQLLRSWPAHYKVFHDGNILHHFAHEPHQPTYVVDGFDKHAYCGLYIRLCEPNLNCLLSYISM